MLWIKAHLTIVICGALSLVSVVLIVLGVFLSDVTDAMAQDANLSRQLVSIEPTNERVVTHWERLRDENRTKAEASTAELDELSAHEPLTGDLFPTVRDTYAPFQFQDDFAAARRELVALLRAADRPSPQEIEREKLQMQETARHRQDVDRLGTGERPTETRRQVTGLRQPAAQASPVARREALTPEQRVEEDPEVRVSLRRAREIFCYMDLESTLGSYPAITSPGHRPALDQAWYAQIALWIQRDVAEALAALNNRAADALESAGEQPWVGNLPVKHIRAIDVGCYVPGTPDAENIGFTRRGSGGAVDVVEFEVDMVVCARRLPEVISELCAAGFYTPLHVEYRQVPPNMDLTGYIYGSDPVLSVLIKFEACFLRTKYEPWMPESVIAAITAGQACPERSERADRRRPATGGGGGGVRGG
jgi:hypothetical protein